MYEGVDPKKYCFVDYPEMRFKETEERPVLVGHDAVNLHQDDEYILRYPIKYGAFNVSPQYHLNQCIDDLATIITESIEKEMKLPKENLHNFSCILVIPDTCVKIHMRYMIDMLFNLGFKSMFIHQESVMATYAMALPTAVVVDIGSTKTSVCCIEEGIIIAKSVLRKHQGGDDQTTLLARLLSSDQSLHYFPQNILSTEYHQHKNLIERVKEENSSMEMTTTDIVKTCALFLKDKNQKS